MNKWLVALCLFLAVVRAVEEDNVVVLTAQNFDSIVNGEELILVEFYAPWCGHCKKLAPEYAKAAGILKSNDPPVKLAKADADAEKDLATRFSISGFPTLKVFRNGVAGEYKGPRDADGIVSYMLKQVGPSAKPLKTKEDVEKFVNHHDVSVVYFGDAGAKRDVFSKVADSLREEFRMAIADSSVASALGLGEGAVIFHSALKNSRVFGGSYENAALTEWIYAKSIPLVGEYTKDSSKRYLKANQPILKVFFDVDYGSNLKRTNYYLNRIRKVAEELKSDKIIFTYANKKDFTDDLGKFGISDKAVGMGIDDVPNTRRFKAESEFSVESLKKFIEDFNAGALKAYIKSEPRPNPDNDGGVKIVTGETFNEIVMDPNSDILFEMYAPWCGHCKKLEPIYKELAESVKTIPGVVIAKMDATANDSPHSKYTASGYPTIYYAPAHDKHNPVKYSGPREVKAFTDFLKSKASAGKWN